MEEPADERKRDDFATAGRLDGARVRGLHPRYSSAASCHADFLATTILVCLADCRFDFASSLHGAERSIMRS